MPEKILSISMCGRNDGYGKDFLRRYCQSMNLLAYAAEKIGAIDKIEVVFADWNCEAPMVAAVHLSQPAAQIVKFVEVPPEIAIKYNTPYSPMHSSVAPNVACRRCVGRYIGMMPNDIMLTSYTLARLLEVLEGKLSVPFDPGRSLMGVPRKLLPFRGREEYFFTSTEEIEKILSRNDYYISDDRHARGSNAYYGMILMRRENWVGCRGLEEQIWGWGRSDQELGLRVSDRHPLVNLSGYGVHCYDFEPNHKMRREKLGRNTLWEHVIAGKVVNSPDWGIGQYELKMTQAPPRSPEPLPPPKLQLKTLVPPRLRKDLRKFAFPVPALHVKGFSAAGLLLAGLSRQIQPRRLLAIGSEEESNLPAVSWASPFTELVINCDRDDNIDFLDRYATSLNKCRHVGDVFLLAFRSAKLTAECFDVYFTAEEKFDLVFLSTASASPTVLTALAPRIDSGLTLVAQYRDSRDLTELKTWRAKFGGETRMIDLPRYRLAFWIPRGKCSDPDCQLNVSRLQYELRPFYRSVITQWILKTGWGKRLRNEIRVWMFRMNIH